MKDKDNKLAEEILEKNISMRGLIDFGNYSCVGIPYEDALKAMQAYHESKLRESKIVESFERENQYVTDEDIQAWALKRVIIDMQPKSRINTASENAYKRGLIEAATAMRDGKINPVSRDNDR